MRAVASCFSSRARGGGCFGAYMLLVVLGVLLAMVLVVGHSVSAPVPMPGVHAVPLAPTASPFLRRVEEEQVTGVSSRRYEKPVVVHKSVVFIPPLEEQLSEYEATLPSELVENFRFQGGGNGGEVPRSTVEVIRPHTMSYDASLAQFPIPVPASCPSPIRPDAFCAPNLGRDWKPTDTVYPLSYSLPEELFVKEVPQKTKDCADIVPRVRGSYRFTSEADYVAEYSRSFYCLTFKKGGWDVLRHYEVIAAGCMPYLVDLEYTPVYTLFHMPKQLLLEARDLPGVHFNCSSVRVVIDHRIFPRERYFSLLGKLLEHARAHLTTKAMAQYVLNASGKPQAKRVLYLAAGSKRAPLRAQGNYNSWTLFHGLRTLLGPGCVDPFRIPFLYRQSPDVVASMKKSLYGLGFGYAFRLEDRSDVDRENILQKIMTHHYDLVIFADPTSLVSSSSKQIKLLKLVQKTYTKAEIIWLHAPDIAYPMPQTQGYSPAQLYETGVVFQREIMDCQYYAPPNRKAEAMKRCVWYLNRNCFDDVNVQQVKREKMLARYVWTLPEIPSQNA